MSQPTEKSESELKNQRASTKGCITRIKNLVEQKAETLSDAELECRLGILEAYFKQILSYQTDIEKLAPSDTNEAKFRGEIEDLYCATKSKILSLRSCIRKSSIAATSSDTNASIVVTNTTTHHLPKLKLPHFAGKYSEYPKFIKTFDQLVNKECNLTTIEKFNHLLSCLSGPALRTVKALGVTEDNYPKALERLRERYDNKCLIFQEHISQLFELPKIAKNSADQLRGLIDNVNAHYSALLSLGSAEDISNAMIIHLVMSCVDSDSQVKWDEAIDYSTLPSWKKCAEVLNRRCQFLEARESKRSDERSKESARQPKFSNSRRQNITSLTVTPANCAYCHSSGHSIYQCSKFTSLSVLDRYSEVKRLTLCINCLSKGHSVKKCVSSKCRVCNFPHHTLLHRFNTPAPTQNEISSTSKDISAKADNSSEKESNDSQAFNVTSAPARTLANPDSCREPDIGHTFLATAVVKLKDSIGRYHIVRALLDSASQVNFLTEDIAQRLQLKREKKSIIVSGIGEVNAMVRHKTQVSVRSRVNNFETDIECLIIPRITEAQPEKQVDISQWGLPPNLELADPLFYKPQKVDILIGAELFFQLLCVGQISTQDDLPTLQKSVLGWIVSGRYKIQKNKDKIYCQLVAGHEYDDNDLKILVEKFWQVENLDSNRSYMTEEQERCEKIFLETIKRTPDGRLMVKLPFKDDLRKLGQSIQIAKNRFTSLERRLNRNPTLKAQYCNFLEEYLAAGHMEQVTKEDIPAIHYFIPHQCVVRPDSSTTKLRVVFDASCRTATQLSLNDMLMVGPTIQDDLMSIILRFRYHKFALTADISAMYRQILVYPEDTHMQYILWRENCDDDLKIFRLKTVTYGTASAPFLATRCLHWLADEFKESHPTASQVIKTDFYMDDLITGADNLDQLLKIRSEVEYVLNSAHLPLRKWYTNNLELLQQIPEASRETPLRINDTDIIKALGITWEPEADQFHFIQSPPIVSTVTKRTFLSSLCSLFDLLGLINPVIVKAKVFVQELWLLNLNWDESVPQHLDYRWREYENQLKDLVHIRIPRFVLSPHEVVNIDLHGFADASTRAYGGCIYVRCEDSTGSITVHLLSAKSKVAPCRPTRSLPCLELCAADLLASLLQKVQSNFPKSYRNVYLWTDSEIVLDWLAGHPSDWKTFVSNRVSRIQELTSSAIWRHVPSYLIRWEK